jgi:PAS domain S-box-containing protein
MAHGSKPTGEQLFDLAPDTLVVVDRAGHVAYVNRQAERMFGRERNEMIGRSLESLVPARFREAWAGLVADGGSDGPMPPSGNPLDFVGLHENGSEFPVEVTRSIVGVAEGTHVVLALRDVSLQRRAQEERQTLASRQAVVSELGRRALTGIDLLQLMGEAAALARSNLGVDYVNVLELMPDGSILFEAGAGWEEGLVGRLVTEAVNAIPAAQVLLTQTPVIVEDFSVDDRFPDASFLRDHDVVSSLTVPLYGHGRPFGALGAHSTRRRPFPPEDVAFLQSVANVLSAAMERNWYEQRQRERYMQRAEQMMALGQVAAGVAHELRNPLTAVKGLIQVNLRKAAAGGLPSEDLAVIEHEIRRMERTLQTFLDFARPPQPDRRRLNLADVVDRVFAVVNGRAKKQQVSLRFLRPDAPVRVEADQDQLQQLLLNLVLNALDAMPGGGTAEIDLHAPREGQVELSVRDTGPGIAAHILPKVFETFVSSKETGVGLGVPVSRRIAEDHGGSLCAYNLPGGGACFVLRLPALGSQ